MEYFERQLFSRSNIYVGPTFFKRYVDDVSVIFTQGNKTFSLEIVNHELLNVMFTIEEEAEGKFPFLDTLIVGSQEQ
ncbi:hypothetical protein M514_09494 [Trichuris suis]|uniref:Reverse transcriptase domain-containing protein n=1 Tax=Trichuris suis TaxID=68888 RepID=A0A085NA22_9BILA|nr:hypothetical protein M513_09494 [Trichuris suis]KFD66318.1 hypothetical protein M514_09494 [Trichuris suis]